MMTGLILYNASETSYTTQGIGALSDAINATVDYTVNGNFTLSVDYPISGVLYEEIQPGRQILCQPWHNGDIQSFEVISVKENENGQATLECVHISDRLRNHFISPSIFTGVATLQEAVSALTGELEAQESLFTITAATDRSWSPSVTTPIDALSVIEELIKDYGVELEYSNYGYTLNIVESVGADRGSVIRYGYNLVDFEITKTNEDAITTIQGYYNSQGNVVIGDQVDISDYTDRTDIITDYKKVKYIDLTEQFSSVPTSSDLTNMTIDIIEENISSKLFTESVNADVSFFDLSRTLNYKDIIQNGEDIRPGDTVTVSITRQGLYGSVPYLELKKRVISSSWDTLNGDYESLSMTDPPRLGLTLNGQQIEPETAFTSSSGLPLTGSAIISKMANEEKESSSGSTSSFTLEGTVQRGDGYALGGTIPIYGSDITTIPAGQIIAVRTEDDAKVTITNFDTDDMAIFRGDWRVKYDDVRNGKAIVNYYYNDTSFSSLVTRGGSYGVSIATTKSGGTLSGLGVSAANLILSIGDISGIAGEDYSKIEILDDYIEAKLVANVWINRNILPQSASWTVSLGSDSCRWHAVYARTLYGTLATTSDRKKKKNITPIKNDTDTNTFLQELEPVLFNYTSETDNDPKHLGLIAQDVLTALENSNLPNLSIVNRGSDGFLYINYTELIPLLIDQVQRLSKEVQKLTKAKKRDTTKETNKTKKEGSQ